MSDIVTEPCRRVRCPNTVTPPQTLCPSCQDWLAGAGRAAAEQAERRPHVVRKPQLATGLMLQPSARKEPVRRTGATPEALVLREVVKALELVPGLHIMRNSVGMVTTQHGRLPYGLGVGSSDIVGILAPTGRWVCIEVKSADGETTQAQRAWLERMRSLGSLVGVARSGAEALAIVRGT